MIVAARNSASWVNIAVIGPHQHGKSTLTGFLLNALHQISTVRMSEAEIAASKRNEPNRKFAFILDRGAHEREITAMGCRGTHKTSWWIVENNRRHFTLSNNPGCPLYNTSLPGALSDADALLLVVDTGAFLHDLARKQTMNEHHMSDSVAQIYTQLSLARFYGIQQLIIALHKMDEIHFSQEMCLTARASLEHILQELGWKRDQVRFIPTAIMANKEKDYNIIESELYFQQWFPHPFLFQAIEELQPRSSSHQNDFRMQLNSVKQGRRVRIPEFQLSATGKISAGTIRINDELLIQPSATRCKVRSIHYIDNEKYIWPTNSKTQQKSATVGEPVYLLCAIVDGDKKVSEGEVAGTPTSFPSVKQRLRAELTPLATSAFSNLSTKKPSGNFIMGYFHTRFTLEDVSLDSGITWVCTGIKSPRQKRQALVHAINSSQPGTTLLADIHLTQRTPLETYADNNILGRFVLFDSASTPMFGGRIREVL